MRAQTSWLRLAWLVAALAALALLLAACDGDGDDDDAAGGDAVDVDGDDGDDTAKGEFDTEATLRLAQTAGPSQWDPHLGRSAVVDYSWHSLVYDSLVRMDGNLDVGPELATDWEISDDGLTYTFNLRDDVTFHDGEPFNADAVVANLERARDLEGALTADQLADVESVEAVDEFTVELTLTEADPSFLYTLAMLQAGRIASPAALEDPDALATEPVGSGPYELAEQTEETASYDKVEHWDEEINNRAPARIEMQAIVDDGARLNALETGDIDGMSVLDPRPEVLDLDEQDGFTLHRFDEGRRTITMMFNHDREPFDDVRVRRALSKAINREAITEQLIAGICEPAVTPFPEDFPDSEIAAELEYDPEGARELLEEAGVTEAQWEALSVSSPLFVNIAEAMQAQFSELGLNMDITTQPSAQLLATWREGELDFYANTTIQGYPDDHLRLREWYYGANHVGPVPEELRQLDQEANQHPLGSSEREEAYREVATVLAEEVVAVELCQWPLTWLTADHVGGLEDMTMAKLQAAWSARPLGVLAEE